MTARRLTILFMLAGTALIALPAWYPPNIRLIWNASASVPVGLYRIVPLHVSEGDRLDVTDLAVVVPPDDLATFLDERGYLPKGAPLLKRVLALGGVEVCRVGSAIIAYDMSYGRAREHDSQGRPLPVWQGCRILADGEAFFMNWDSPDSFDGRYFGPLPITTVVGRAIPIWTTGDPNPSTDNDDNPALNAP